MTRWLALVLVLAACKTRGEIAVTLDYAAAGSCSADVTSWRAYAIRDGNCDVCTCGACFGLCDDASDGCEVACAGGACAPDPAVVDLQPGSGSWAVVVDMYDADGALRATTCEEIVFERDGTEDQDVTLPVRCVDAAECGLP